MTDPALRAIVIGAGGSSGEAFAAALHRNAAEGLAVDSDELSLARVRADTGFQIRAIDVLEPSAIEALFDEFDANDEGIDVLINVAGQGYVRTLAMMRASRAFCARRHEHIAYIVNVAAPTERDGGPITYASSEVAFDRLSEGLSHAVANNRVRIITVHRLDSQVAIDDLVDRLCAEIRHARGQSKGGTARVVGH